MEILKEKTKSLCPKCLQEIFAQVYTEDEKIYIRKSCPQHGDFQFLIEKNANIYKELMNKNLLLQRAPFTNLMIAITHSCNLNCPICYLPNRDTPDLPLEEIKNAILNFDGLYIRLSGGEPTLRSDLPQIISFICQKNKIPILITNGLKLADRNYVKELKRAGLSKGYVNFSFNGFDSETYRRINGLSLLKIKLRALKNLARENMKVTLSVLLEKGVNEKELKKIFHFCLQNNQFIFRLRIRVVAAIGRYGNVQEKIYLSDIISMISKIIRVNKEKLLDHIISSSQEHFFDKTRDDVPCFPCRVTINFSKLLLQLSRVEKIRIPLFKKINIIIQLLSRVNLKTMLIMLVKMFVKKIKGKSLMPNFLICIRVFPDKNSIDLDEIKRCTSSCLVSENKEIVPLCYGFILNRTFFQL